MTSVLITGTSRGIGLKLVEELAARENAPELILATCRDVAGATKLKAVAEKYKNVKILQLDVTNVSSFEAFANEVSSIVGEKGLNVLINNAGIAAYKTSLKDMTESDYLNVYKTNLVGPVFVTKALLPLIEKAAKRNADVPKGMNRAVIMNISSLLGSVELNTIGNHYAYRESKAALNTFTRSLSVEVADAGIVVISVCPGWVKTDLGGPTAHLTPEESISRLLKLLYSLNETNHGKYYGCDGLTHPW